MVIVPAFSQREEGNQGIVTAFILGLIASPAKQMAQRIDREHCVVKDDGTDHESADKSAPTSNYIGKDSQQNSRNPVQVIENSKFREASPILYKFPINRVVIGRKDPANV